MLYRRAWASCVEPNQCVSRDSVDEGVLANTTCETRPSVSVQTVCVRTLSVLVVQRSGFHSSHLLRDVSEQEGNPEPVLVLHSDGGDGVSDVMGGGGALSLESLSRSLLLFPLLFLLRYISERESRNSDPMRIIPAPLGIL